MWHGGIGGLGTLAAFGKVWCGIGELGECGIGALGHWAYLEGDRPAVGVTARPVKGTDAAARAEEVAGDAATEVGLGVRARVRARARARAKARARARARARVRARARARARAGAEWQQARLRRR